MSTGLRFLNAFIPGIVEPFPEPSREVQLRRTHFFGLRGESQINGEPGGRSLQIPMLVFERSNKFNTSQMLVLFLEANVGQLIGKTGILQVLLSERVDIYPETCLDGFSIRPFPSVIKDYAGTLGGKYFCMVDFTFRQL